jgi:hypothetical protein
MTVAIADITLAVAVLGAVLGIINTCHALSRSRLKLRVLPAHAIPIGSADARINFSIEVTNLSEFAVTIREAGFLLEGTEARASMIRPILLDGGTWPRRLEPRTSVTAYAIVAPPLNNGPRIRCAYARTDCGRQRTGNSPALDQIAGRVAEPGFIASLLLGGKSSDGRKGLGTKD